MDQSNNELSLASPWHAFNQAELVVGDRSDEGLRLVPIKTADYLLFIVAVSGLSNLRLNILFTLVFEDNILDKVVAFEEADYCCSEGWEKLAREGLNICIALHRLLNAVFDFSQIVLDF